MSNEEKKVEEKKAEESKEADAMEVDEEEKENQDIDLPHSSEIEEKVQVIIAETKSSNNCTDGIERLLYLEKKQRQAEHEGNTLYIAFAILNFIYEEKNWQLLIEQIAVIARRRSQFRRVVKRIVQKAMEWIDKSPNKEIQKSLIDTLIGITEGKIFVEVEKARLTRKLSQLKEQEGKVTEAADILQELQIETFGSMRKKEKCDFLLEQVRLCLAKRDFVRAGIIRNKITRKILSNLKELEIRYWNLSLIYYYNSVPRNYLELGKSFQNLKNLLTNEQEQKLTLQNSVFAIVLANYSNEQNDLLHKTLSSEMKLLESLPVFKQLLKILTTWELIQWPLSAVMHNTLTKFSFDNVGDNNQNFEEILRDRIIQHNIRVIAKYYTRISLKRMTQFLGVDSDKTERYISDMVTDHTIYVRIDRLDGILRFKKKETPNSILNDWRTNIDKLLDLIDNTGHQIHKEMVIHGKGGGGGDNKNEGGKGPKGKKNKKAAEAVEDDVNEE